MTSKPFVSPTDEADEVVLEARDEPVVADDQRHPLGRPALERCAVDAALELDDGVVALLGTAVLDGRQAAVLVAKLLDDAIDLGVVDGLDLGPEIEVLVVAENDLGADLDGRLEDERLALLGLDDLDVRVREGQQRLLDEGVAVRVLHEPVDGFVEDGAGAEDRLEDAAWRLAGPEAGDSRPLRERSDGLADRAVKAIGRDFDLEDDRALGGRGGSDVHRRGSIGRVAGRGGEAVARTWLVPTLVS